MENKKSYALSEGQKAEVNKALAEGKKNYAKIAHIVCESEMDAGVFFEHELKDRSSEA